MQSRSRQSGASFLSIAFVLVVVGIFGYIGLKLFPIYSESFKVESSMENLAQDDSLRNMSKMEIVDALVRRLEVNDVDFVNRRTYQNYVSVAKDTGGVSVTVTYRREVPIFGNLSLVMDFDKTVRN